MNNSLPAPVYFKNKLHYILFMMTIIIIAAIGFVASDIYLPSLPSIANYYHKNSLQVQLTMSVFLLTMAFFQIFIGALSDKFGRKLVLFFAIVIFIFASLGCYGSTTLNMLILFRFFQGIGAACGLSVGQAIIADLFGPKESAKYLSIVIPLVAFSPAIAPILGGIIEEKSNWRNVFLFLAGYGLVILLLLPLIPKLKLHLQQDINNLENKPKKNWHTILEIIKNKEFVGYALFMMNSNACYFAFLAASPFLMRQFGYTPTQVGYAFCAASFPYMFASILGRRLAIKFNHTQIILIGLIFNIIGALLMIIFSFSHWQNMACIMIPIFVMCTGNGLIMPFSSSGAIALFPKNAGLITGSLATMQLCAASFGTFAMGIFANGTLFPLAFFNFSCVLFVIFYFSRVFRKQI